MRCGDTALQEPSFPLQLDLIMKVCIDAIQTRATSILRSLTGGQAFCAHKAKSCCILTSLISQTYRIAFTFQPFLTHSLYPKNMVAFCTIAVGLTAVAGAFAAPTAGAVEDLPDFELTNTTNLVRRQDYNQNYKTSGSVNYSPTNDGYSVSFTNAGDFVVGKGWKTGTARYAHLQS